MQTESFTRAILKKHGFQSYDKLAATVDAIPDRIFTLRQLNKQDFKKKLSMLIDHIELEGFAVRESRAMTVPGAIFESMSGDYLEIRRSYIMLRKRLIEKLELLTEMRSTYVYLSDPGNWKSPISANQQGKKSEKSES